MVGGGSATRRRQANLYVLIDVIPDSAAFYRWIFSKKLPNKKPRYSLFILVPTLNLIPLLAF